MAGNKQAIIQWGSRAHLACLTVVLGYGAVAGNLTTAYSHSVIAVMFNPAFVGISMALSGTVLSVLFATEPQIAQGPNQITANDDTIWDDDSDHFRYNDSGGLSMDLSESMDFGISDTDDYY